MKETRTQEPALPYDVVYIKYLEKADNIETESRLVLAWVRGLEYEMGSTVNVA